MTNNRRAKIIALSVTIVLCALMIAMMLMLTLKRAEHSERTWPPVDSSELLFEGEYVKLGDIPEPEQNDNNASEAEATDISGIDRTNAGTPEQAPAPVLTSEQESPAKVTKKPQPENPGPTKEELEQQQKEKLQQEQSQQIANRVKFGGSGSGKGNSGKSGSPNGNADHGALSGAPGTSLKGRSLESWARPTGHATGTIVVSVRVNRQGKVIAASYSRGTGAVAANTAARQSCVQAAKNSRFSVSMEAPAEQTGTITYKFD
ncbi:MAG: hypothetical protein K2O88_02160 [Paramuribaculum sp.]|nr:hypothetical protein [Paramuribaculum sp.]